MRDEHRPSLTVVIVTYNSEDFIGPCLTSLLPQLRPHDKVVVLDNASSDSTLEVLEPYLPRVELIASRDNLGFAAGCNRASCGMTTDFLLLLNPDTVVHPGCCDALLDLAARRPDAGLVGGRTMSPDGSLNPLSCLGLPTLWSNLCYALGLSSAFSSSELFNPEYMGAWDRGDEREVGLIVGCLLLVEAELWRRLGGFDTTYFMYSEDADLAVRARALGYRPRINPDACITHAVGASSTRGDKLVLLLKGKVTLARRHQRPVTAAVIAVLLQLGTALRAHVGHGESEALRRSAWQEAWRRRKEWRQGYGRAVPKAAL